MDAPHTRYARVGGAHVAYQVTGDGDEAVLFMLGLSTHLDAMWEEPGLARYLRRIAGFSRLAMFDRRGAGLSDPLVEGGTLDAHVDDALAVLDAAGIEQVTVIAANESSLIAIPFAASHPERVRRLVVINGTARFMWADDYDIGVRWDQGRAYTKAMTDTYAELPTGIAASAPSKAGDAAFEVWALRYQRLAASPGSFERTTRLVGRTDVRSVLPLVTCPSLVLHCRDDRFIPIEHGQYLADHLPSSTFVELDGADHLPWTGPDTPRSLDEVERFVTGDAVARVPDRVLATIVFTDIVDSTKHLERLGDRPWADLVESHHAIIAGVVQEGGGRIVDTAGDGVFAVFDAPSRGIAAAHAIRTRVAALGLEVRAGVHTGEVEVLGDAVRGVAVHTAARVMAVAADGGVVVSRTVRDLVSGSGFRFEALGPHRAEGARRPGRPVRAGDVIEAYRVLVDRVLALAAESDPSTPLPACPAWTVRHLVAHLTALAEDWVAGDLDDYGSDAWTARQVARGRGASADELAARWRRAADQLAGVPDHPRLGSPVTMAYVDAVTHEADLRGAVGRERVPDDAVDAAMKPLVARWRQSLAGTPSLLVRVAGGRDWAVGSSSPDGGAPAVSVDVPLYDLFRALTGRRSARQVAAWAWAGDPTPYLEAGLPFPFSWAAEDITD